MSASPSSQSATSLGGASSGASIVSAVTRSVVISVTYVASGCWQLIAMSSRLVSLTTPSSALCSTRTNSSTTARILCK